MSGSLYLAPCFIGSEHASLLSARTLNQIHQLTHFIVEREKTARAFLKQIAHPVPQKDLMIHELDKHGNYSGFEEFFNTNIKEHSIGMISEAGLPAIADPGAKVAMLAHQNNIRVVPLSGSSSIFLALMASGMGGQKFTFHGYLPIDHQDRIKTLKQLEKSAHKETHIFMETPYRNNKLLELLLQKLQPHTRLCIAADIESEQEFIRTQTISDWKKDKIDLHKRPCIFVMRS